MSMLRGANSILRTYVESYVSDILAAEIRADSRMSFKADDAVYIIWSNGQRERRGGWC
jgi:hypothetical protein